MTRGAAVVAYASKSTKIGRRSGLRCARQAQAQVVALLEVVGNAGLRAVQVKHHRTSPTVCQAFHLQAQTAGLKT